jgi:hypothetical protein
MNPSGSLAAPTAAPQSADLVVPFVFSASVNASQNVTVYADTLSENIVEDYVVHLHVPIATLNNVFSFRATETNSTGGANGAASALGVTNLSLDFTGLASNTPAVAAWNSSFDYLVSLAGNVPQRSQRSATDSAGSTSAIPPFGEWRNWLMSNAAFRNIDSNDAVVSAESHSFSQDALFNTTANPNGVLLCVSDTILMPFYRTAAVYGKVSTADVNAADSVGLGNTISAGRYNLTLSQGDTIVAFVKFHEKFELNFSLNGNASLNASFSDGTTYQNSAAGAGLAMIVNNALINLTNASADQHKVYKLIFTASGLAA